MSSEYGVILLCGGMSRRMGRSKCDLPFGNETLLQRTIRTIEPFSSEIILSAAPESTASEQEITITESRYPVIRDQQANQGPLTGLYDLIGQVSEMSRWKAALICSCDMPFLSLETLEELQKQFENSAGTSIVVFKEESQIHPFPGLYSQKSLHELETIWKSGRRKMFDLLEMDEVKMISIDEYPHLKEKNVLMNVNCPEEYQKALELAGLPPNAW